MAERLLHAHYRGAMPITPSSYPSEQQHPPHLSPSVLPHPTRTPPTWQRDELTTLLAWDERMRIALLHAQGTWIYLEERGIPLEVAQATGVGYLSPALLTLPETRQKRSIGRRWAERIVFPLVSPAGRGYIGRSLWRWRPGMDENAHKALLEQPGAPRHWIKTNPAGWFCAELDQLARCIILVEGAFDRLALLAAGFQAQEVVALVGTAAQADWFPPQVQAVVLALDGDEGGTDATRRLAERLARAGLCTRVCLPGQDRWGKDWNERWRRIGPQSLWPLYEAYSAVLRSA